MMIMRWCTVQTNEYDLQAKTYPNICTLHKLHNNNENKFPVFPERLCNKWQYPTLGCEIQGFRVMGLSVQYWPRWFQDFPAIWLAVPFGANGAHLRRAVPRRKNLLCVWNKLFLCEIKFSQRRTRPVTSLQWQVIPMQESTNEWKI